jgi:V/A-type H+-transporting ATPase subunit E
MGAPELPSVGVQSLIERLRAEGVEAGRLEAQQLLEAARIQAAAILCAARQEAERLSAEAAEGARRERAAVAAAFELARRDVLLRLREDVERQVVRRLRELSANVTSDPMSMTELAMQVLRTAIAAEPGQAGLIAESADGGLIDRLVGELAREPAMQRIRLERRDGNPRGLRLQIGADPGEHQLDEESLCMLLAEHVLPRFRRLLEGLGPHVP